MKSQRPHIFFIVLLSIAASAQAYAQSSFVTELRVGSQSEGDVVARMADGGYLIGGNCIEDSGGIGRALLVRVDANGHRVWSSVFVQNGFDSTSYLGWVVAIAPGPDGSAICAIQYRSRGMEFVWGSGLAKVDRTGSVLWTRNLGHYLVTAAMPMVQTRDGGVVLLRSNEGSDYGTTYFYYSLAKFDSLGSPQWESRIGEDDSVRYLYGGAISQAPDGSFYVVGSGEQLPRADYNGTVLRVSEEGKLIWCRLVADHSYVDLRGVGVAPDGGCFVGGTIDDSTTAVYASRIDSTGKLVWAAVINTGDLPEVSSLTVMSSKEIILTGQVRPPGQSGGRTRYSGFVARLSGDGAVRDVQMLDAVGHNSRFLGACESSDGMLLATGTADDELLLARFDSNLDACQVLPIGFTSTSGGSLIDTFYHFSIDSVGDVSVGSLAVHELSGTNLDYCLLAVPDSRSDHPANSIGIAYPNPAPANSIMRVHCQSGAGVVVQVVVRNALGEAVCRWHVASGDTRLALPLPNWLIPGMYVLELVDASGEVRSAAKIIVTD